MYNRVTLIGRVGRDPEVRHAQSGSKIVTFSLATTETWKQDGERKERTEWSNIVVFNEHIGDVAEKYVRKGSLIAIEGQLQTRKWEKDGQTHYTTEVVIPKFRGELRLLTTKADSDRPANAEPDEDPNIPF